MTAAAEANPHLRRASSLGAVSATPRRVSRWYSHYVGAMKILLPLTALGIAALLTGWQSLYPSGQRARAATERASVEELALTQMVNPRFSGIDDHGQPFVVAADLALPSRDRSSVTDLTRPRGEMTLSNGRVVNLTAERGAYERDARYLDLAGEVTLVDDQGYRFVTANARIDTANSRVEGSEPVHGIGPAGELLGEGFRIEDRGMRLIVTGHSQLILRGSEALPQTIAAQPEPATVAPPAAAEPPPVVTPIQRAEPPPRSATPQRRAQTRRAEPAQQRRAQRPRQDRTR
jgi:lipopolysaccharide export system protein LptC